MKYFDDIKIVIVILTKRFPRVFKTYLSVSLFQALSLSFTNNLTAIGHYFIVHIN